MPGLHYFAKGYPYTWEQGELEGAHPVVYWERRRQGVGTEDKDRDSDLKFGPVCKEGFFPNSKLSLPLSHFLLGTAQEELIGNQRRKLRPRVVKDFATLPD